MHSHRDHGVSFHDIQNVKRPCVLIKNGPVAETIYVCRIGLSRAGRGKYLLSDPGRGDEQIDHKRFIALLGVIAALRIVQALVAFLVTMLRIFDRSPNNA